MSNDNELIARLEDLFHSESVAIVGAPRGMKVGKIFLTALLDQKYPGKIYPVHPEADEIDGLKAYPSVSAIPGPVDLAIVLVPHTKSLEVVRECAAKGVKGAVLFTAGYGETGTQEGIALQEQVLRIAQSSGMRLIGPNAMGFYVPSTGLSLFPELSRKSGPVGIIANSGSLTNIIGRTALKWGLYFSKVVSIGNECDLTCTDFLSYMADDADTGVIGCYIEGIKDGPRFLKILRRASLNKPVIVWKVGLTDEGSRAAASHTSALEGSKEIWQGVARQGGVIPVSGYEAWVDALMGCSMLTSRLGDRLAIISGPGALAVGAAEACGNEGLRLAELSGKTKSQLAEFVPPTGTSLRNPIDLGLTAAINVDIYARCAQIVSFDSNVDSILIVGTGLTREDNEKYTETLIRVSKEISKPLIVVDVPGFDKVFAQKCRQAGVPFFDSSERAMRTYAQIRNYQLWRDKRKEAV